MTQHSSSEQGRAFAGVIDVLNAVDATYAIWGGLAVVAYGEPRFTQDMDILLRLDGQVARLMVKRLKQMNYHIDEIQVNRCILGGFFNAIDLNTLIKVDFWVPEGEAAYMEALRNRVFLPFDEIRQAAYISAESAIITKLIAYKSRQSTRDLDDIASIVRIQGNKLNRRALDEKSAEIGLFGVWRSLRPQ